MTQFNDGHSSPGTWLQTNGIVGAQMHPHKIVTDYCSTICRFEEFNTQTELTIVHGIMSQHEVAKPTKSGEKIKLSFQLHIAQLCGITHAVTKE